MEKSENISKPAEIAWSIPVDLAQSNTLNIEAGFGEIWTQFDFRSPVCTKTLVHLFHTQI